MFWTKYHVYVVIPTIIVGLISSFFIGKALKNKEDKVKMLPIKIVTCVLLLLEVSKQLYGIIKGYDLYWIPLHFCSLFLYSLPLASFYNGKYKNEARILAAVVSTCLFLFMVVYPNIIYSDECVKQAFNFITGRGGWFIDFHSVLFHSVALFAFFLFAFLDICTFKTKRDVIVIIIGFGIYCALVGPLSQIIKVNFNNFYHSNAPFLENMRTNMIASLSWVGQLIYVLIVSVGTIVVPLLSYFIMRGTKRIITIIK